MPLNEQHSLFCQRYVIHFNAAKAAREAGFSEKTARQQGARLLTRVDIQVEIKRLTAGDVNRAEITRERVLRELAKIGFLDLRKIARWGMRPTDDGEVPYVSLVDSEEISDEAAAAIASIRMTANGPAITFHSKTDALDKLARHLGLFDEAKATDDDANLKEVVGIEWGEKES